MKTKQILIIGSVVFAIGVGGYLIYNNRKEKSESSLSTSNMIAKDTVTDTSSVKPTGISGIVTELKYSAQRISSQSINDLSIQAKNRMNDLFAKL